MWRFLSSKRKSAISLILAPKTYAEMTVLSLLLLTELKEVTVL